MSESLVSCLTCTFGRPKLLGEAVKCFIDQDYSNKELIVLNDQVGVELYIENCPDNIRIYNHPYRFNSLGEKRNYIKTLGNGEYFCIWDDDDLYDSVRITESIKMMHKGDYDIVKAKCALMSVNNSNYVIANNLFHSQSCITKKYMDKTNYPNKSVGEDIDFEKDAKIYSGEIKPFLIYRWGLNIHHLSGIPDEKKSWEKSLHFPSYQQLKGRILINPVFKKNYWKDVENALKMR